MIQIKPKGFVLKLINSIVIIGVLMFTTAACTAKVTAHTQKQEIVVYAAASLTETMEVAKAIYETTHPDVKIVFNFAGSQVLANQILSGGNPDMFFSANEKYIEDDNRIIFAKNRLVILADERLGLTTLDDVFEAIETRNIGVVIASEEVPVGKYTLAFLKTYFESTQDNEGYDTFLQSVLSYESNVKNVLAKSKLHEADIVVVYETDAASVDLKEEKLTAIAIPKAYNQIGRYGSICYSKEKQVQGFYDYMVNGDGQKLLADHGFVIGE